jgi:hypothetical protein
MENRNSNASNPQRSVPFAVWVLALATLGCVLLVIGSFRNRPTLPWDRFLSIATMPSAVSEQSPSAPSNQFEVKQREGVRASPRPTPASSPSLSPWSPPTSPKAISAPRDETKRDAKPSGTTQSVGASEITVVTTDPNQLVLAAVRQAVWGGSVACKVQQTSKAQGQQVVLLGDFKTEAIGAGRFRRFRHSVRVAVGETSFDLLQVSDGRMMWTHVGTDSPPRRVILDQVLQSIPNAMQYSDSRPEVNLMMAIGGQAELLRALYHRYNWYKAVGGKLSGVEVWQLVGRLRTEPTRIAGNTPLDDSNSVLGDIQPNLPAEARLTLSRSAKLPYFPYMIEYFDRGKDRQGQPNGFELTTRIEYSDPQSNVHFQDQDFQYRVSDSIDEIKDETQLYLPRAPVAGLTILPSQ